MFVYCRRLLTRIVWSHTRAHNLNHILLWSHMLIALMIDSKHDFYISNWSTQFIVTSSLLYVLLLIICTFILDCASHTDHKLSVHILAVTMMTSAIGHTHTACLPVGLRVYEYGVLLVRKWRKRLLYTRRIVNTIRIGSPSQLCL